MATPRYQVFISSTFRDLTDERKAVVDAILRLSHFPAGMELFPASNATPWAIIERVIRESDYYVLIIAGKYGSTDSYGVSYTEREYDYAVSQNKHVLAFLHAAPENIPAGKSEMSPDAADKLAQFRKKVEKHHCNYWHSVDELKTLVVLGLTDAVSNAPAVGWVRADGVDNQDLQKRLLALQERHDRLTARIIHQTIASRPSIQE
ncbi:MAG: DUF4062 domain-containing protein [Thermoguttaceae bacterium]